MAAPAIVDSSFANAATAPDTAKVTSPATLVQPVISSPDPDAGMRLDMNEILGLKRG